MLPAKLLVDTISRAAFATHNPKSQHFVETQYLCTSHVSDSRERIYDINRRLQTASNGWADLRVGRVKAFRCGLISGLHSKLEVIGLDIASRDFTTFDANFLVFVVMHSSPILAESK